MKKSINAPCPCGSGKKYKKCCLLYHNGKLPATPLELMKSRYSAYAFGKARYIVQTTHPSFREADEAKWLEEIKVFCQSNFQNLTIIEHSYSDNEGFVEFEAEIDGVTLHERSAFIKENGRWYYTKGEVDVHQ